jgi:fatty-acyl-CoA synthase
VLSLKLLMWRKQFNASKYFEEAAAKYPNKIALYFEDRTYTYKELNEAANKVANWATAQGLKDQDVVALLMSNRPEFIITWLGLFKINAIVALINTDVTGLSLEHSLKVCEAKTLILGDECISNLETINSGFLDSIWIWSEKDVPKKPSFQYKSLNSELETASTDCPSPKCREKATCASKGFLIFTSGTTGGLPKAGVLTHKRICDIWISSVIFTGMTTNDIMYVTLPLYHTSGNVIGTSLFHLGGGMALRRKFSASNCISDCRKYKATCMLYIGELLRYLLLTPTSDDDTKHNLRMVFGNGLRYDVWSDFQKRFNIPTVNELYSATEGNIQLVNLGRPHAVGYTPTLLHYKIFQRFAPFCLVRFDVEKEEPIRGPDGYCIRCGMEEQGELIGLIDNSPGAAYGNFQGYHGNAEATKKKILSSAFVKGDSWFRTGDLLRQDTNGFYHFVDRIGDTFRWKGQNVATGEVGNIFGMFDGVKEANCYGVSMKGYEGRVGMVAFVADKNFDFKALYQHLAKNLASYANPVFLRIKKEIDNTGTFKHKKVELVKEGFNPSLVKDPLYFRDDTIKTFVPIDMELFSKIENGVIKV